MDLLRGFAILLVISFHSVTILDRQGYAAPVPLADFNQLFVLYRMPTLVFLSGLLLSGSFKKGVTLYLIGKVRRILWPLAVWSVIYAVIVGPMIHGPMDFLKYLSGQSYLWFLTFILFYYLAAIPLRWVSPLLVAGLAFGLSILAPDGTKNEERLLYLMAFFFLGAWTGARWPVWLAVVRSRWPLLAWPVVITASIAAVVWQIRYGPAYVLPAACFILAVSASLYRVQSIRPFTPLIFIGQNSLIFYVSHFPTIYLVIGACRTIGVESPAIAALVAFPVAIATGLLLTLSARSSRVVDLLFVGPALPSSVQRRMVATEERMQTYLARFRPA
jgi:surface polysaccharide O-acyltransferase-like enzyme